MAVRPWENRFLDINLKDGVMIRENGSAEGKSNTKSHIQTTGKKTNLVTDQPNLSSQRTAASHSDGCGSSSPTKSAGIVEVSSAQVQKLKHKLAPERPLEQVKPKVDTGLRSRSNPKERSAPLVKNAKKRLSLPNNGEFTYSFREILHLLERGTSASEDAGLRGGVDCEIAHQLKRGTKHSL